MLLLNDLCGNNIATYTDAAFVCLTADREMNSFFNLRSITNLPKQVHPYALCVFKRIFELLYNEAGLTAFNRVPMGTLSESESNSKVLSLDDGFSLLLIVDNTGKTQIFLPLEKHKPDLNFINMMFQTSLNQFPPDIVGGLERTPPFLLLHDFYSVLEDNLNTTFPPIEECLFPNKDNDDVQENPAPAEKSSDLLQMFPEHVIPFLPMFLDHGVAFECASKSDYKNLVSKFRKAGFVIDKSVNADGWDDVCKYLYCVFRGRVPVLTSSWELKRVSIERFVLV